MWLHQWCRIWTPRVVGMPLPSCAQALFKHGASPCRQLCARNSSASDERPRTDQATSDGAHQEAASAESAASPGAKQPPENWYKRGTWVNADQIAQRMTDQEPTAAQDATHDTPVGRSLSAMIKYRGPITIAEYMREVLSNPVGGFYAAKGRGAIGRQGHFVTSPEISSIFGETVAAWLLENYNQLLGAPKAVALVELGPGRGTLMKQMLTALGMMHGGHSMLSAATVHLVEVSPDLRQMQFEALQCSAGVTQSRQDEADKAAISAAQHDASRFKGTSALQRTPEFVAASYADSENISADIAALGGGSAGGRGVLKGMMAASDPLVQASSGLGVKLVHWHSSLEQVPDDVPCIVVGHEFLDALPIHMFRRDPQRGWLEVLIDEPPTSAGQQQKLEFVLSPGSTIATRTILKHRLDALRRPEKLQALEVCAEGMSLVEAVALRIRKSGGFALFIDYGQDAPYTSSLNAIRNHAPVEVLEAPGTADLTAWVDFSALRQAVNDRDVGVRALGPMFQGHFLLANGVEARVDALLQNPSRSAADAERLEDALARLVAGVQHHAQGMGETYKVMALIDAAAPTPIPFNIDLADLA